MSVFIISFLCFTREGALKSWKEVTSLPSHSLLEGLRHKFPEHASLPSSMRPAIPNLKCPNLPYSFMNGIAGRLMAKAKEQFWLGVEKAERRIGGFTCLVHNGTQ